MIACVSWLHNPAEPVAADEGFITCADHRGEEEEIRRVEADLAQFAHEVQSFEDDNARHPDQAKDQIEAAVRWFLDRELERIGLSSGTGYRSREGRKNAQLDIVVAMNPTALGWSAMTKVLRYDEREQLVLHLEIAYRSSNAGLLDKVTEDVDRVDRSIRDHLDQRIGLPWTGLVLLGDGWRLRESQVIRHLHHHYHDRVERVESDGSQWWTFPDGVMMPATLYKKHDLFEDSALSGKRWPCFFPLLIGHRSTVHSR